MKLSEAVREVSESKNPQVAGLMRVFQALGGDTALTAVMDEWLNPPVPEGVLVVEEEKDITERPLHGQEEN